MPRIKSAEDQCLYRMDANQHFGELDPFFVDQVDVQLIMEQWESLVRLTASLRQRRVPAHVLVQRLRYDAGRLGVALTALGRVVKSIFLLRYMGDVELRRAVLLQLNRGENRQFLARALFFAQQGELTVGDLPGLINKASCLSLLSNAVLVWNTVQFEKIVAQLRSQGHTIQNEDLAHVTPLLFGHVIPTGAYFINHPDLRG
ncbi:MAG: Tn3 family transposase [Verrucomicrobiae bacterium]|nr:Tn3 family transposase [Verrucomicrobiae bacterium]